MVVSQEDSVFPWLTVAENVGFGCRVQRSGVVAGKQGAVDLWLGRVGLDQVAGAYPRELSGGMRQRVALARAWANEPELLMLDEPLRSLDWPTRLGLQDLIRTVSRRIRQTVLLVTHDPDEALAVADRVVVLDRTAKTVASVTVDLGEGTGLRRRMNHRFSLLQAELSALVYRAAALEGP
jgi:ABC-type nitrate/sulfonate/bicarbonate transport system ATPase subunit